jgi:hypothetical protein
MGDAADDLTDRAWILDAHLFPARSVCFRELKLTFVVP